MADKDIKKIDGKAVMRALGDTVTILGGGLLGGAAGASFDRISVFLGIGIAFGTGLLLPVRQGMDKKALRRRVMMRNFTNSLGVGMIVGQGMTEETIEAEEAKVNGETTQGLGIVKGARKKSINFLKSIARKASLDKIPAAKKALALDGFGQTAERKDTFFKSGFDEAEREVDRLINRIGEEEIPLSPMMQTNMMNTDVGQASDITDLLRGPGSDAQALLNGPGSDAVALMMSV